MIEFMDQDLKEMLAKSDLNPLGIKMFLLRRYKLQTLFRVKRNGPIMVLFEKARFISASAEHTEKAILTQQELKDNKCLRYNLKALREFTKSGCCASSWLEELVELD